MTLTHASTLLWDAYTEQTYNHARKIRIWITYLSSLLKSEMYTSSWYAKSPLCPAFLFEKFYLGGWNELKFATEVVAWLDTLQSQKFWA